MKRADTPSPWPGRAAAWLIALLLLSAGCAAQEQASAPVPAPVVAQAATKAVEPAPARQPEAPPDAAHQAGPAKPGGDQDVAFFADEDEGAAPKPKVTVNDPLEPFNRVMFRFNDTVYRHVLTPVARGYRDTVPVELRTGLSNFFHNLGTPVRVLAVLLQGDLDTVGCEIYRFATNTTVGVLGFGDAAKELLDLPPPSDEDLGQTLGAWGVGHGFYLVLPLLGPSSLRDTAGMVGAWYVDPVYDYVEPLELSVAIHTEEFVNDYSFRVGDYESLADAAVDPYVAMRDFYVKYRQTRVDQ
jgi:phospholipid-binding lipoprotein MlaA